MPAYYFSNFWQEIQGSGNTYIGTQDRDGSNYFNIYSNIISDASQNESIESNYLSTSSSYRLGTYEYFNSNDTVRYDPITGDYIYGISGYGFTVFSGSISTTLTANGITSIARAANNTYVVAATGSENFLGVDQSLRSSDSGLSETKGNNYTLNSAAGTDALYINLSAYAISGGISNISGNTITLNAGEGDDGYQISRYAEFANFPDGQGNYYSENIQYILTQSYISALAGVNGSSIVADNLITYSGGLGNDTYAITFDVSSDGGTASIIENSVILRGNEGNDNLSLSLNSMTLPSNAITKNNSFLIDGGSDNDIIKLNISGNGIFDNDISVTGGSGDDTITAGVTAGNFIFIDGGDGYDTINLVGSVFDLKTNSSIGSILIDSDNNGIQDFTISNFENITATEAAGAFFTVDSAATALLVHGTGIRDSIKGTSFNVTQEQYLQLVANGIEIVTDGSGYSFSTVSYSLDAGVTNLVLTGTAAVDGTGNALANNLTGNDAANTLDGLSGNDVITGNAGVDRLYGGAGEDFLYGGADGDLLDGGADNDSLNGDAGADQLFGGVGADILSGGTEDDLLDGGADADRLNGGLGADRMLGGSGNDTYTVDNAGDVVSEETAFGSGMDAGGTDLVNSAVSFTLGAFVENLTLTGTAAINGTGNTLANSLTGNAAANVLDGGAGADTLSGLGGNDTYLVDNAGDQVLEAAGQGSDTVLTSVSYALRAGQAVESLRTANDAGTTAINLTGNEFAQTLTGNAGANTLDGGGGADLMQGGLGNDTYRVDNPLDLIVEAAGEGTDTLVSTITLTLAAGVSIERMELAASTGTSALNLSGNEFAQTLVGNDGANTLDGKGGADIMRGGLGNDIYGVDNVYDQVIELADQGSDTIISTIHYTLGAGQSVERLQLAAGTSNLNLTGNQLDNKLVGNAGANTLDGKGGADTMQGGLGNDIYGVDNALDLVLEAADQGTDSIISTVSYTLIASQSIERLQLAASTGTSNLNLTGNELANTLVGNDGMNILNGGDGLDTLSGRAGADTFVFSTKLGTGNIDHINDFSAIDDTIQLGRSIFRGLTVGQLDEAAFKDLSLGAVDATDRIIYNKATGALSYDADGSGTASTALQFAILDNKTLLTAADFLIV